MSILIKILAFLVVFGLVVFIHELGHFLVAKLNNIEVRSFMLGFGPKLIKYQGKETEYSLRLIPLGGAVVMVGEEEEDDSPRSFSNKSPLQRIAVLFAGPFMNFLLGFVLFVLILAVNGFSNNVLSDVQKGSPAEAAGLLPGDKIVAINDVRTDSWEAVVANIAKSEQAKMSFDVERGNDKFSVDLEASYNEEEKRYMVGIVSMHRNIGAAIPLSFHRVVDISYQTLMFFPSLLKQPELIDQVSGPIGIATIVGEATELGIWHLILLLAIISVNLGVFNLLPVPPLDGGKIFIYLFEFIFRRPIGKKLEMALSIIGLILVLSLFLFVMKNDIFRLMGWN